MTMSDYMNMVHEAARNLVAVQSATSPSTTEMEDKYMTRQEVAKLLKASLTSLWRWNKEGILCNYKDGNAKVVYLKEEVYDFIKTARTPLQLLTRFLLHRKEVRHECSRSQYANSAN